MIALMLFLGAVQDNVCHVELAGLEVRNAELQQALTADGVALNRSPEELNSLSVEISLYADNGVKFRSMQKAFFSRVPPRKGLAIEIKEAPLGTIKLGGWKARVSYRIGDKDYAFDFDGPRLKNGKYYDDPEGGTRLGLAGLRTVQGSYQKQAGAKTSVYTGDTLFLRLRIEGMVDTDRPAGPLEMTLSVDGKKRGTVKRTIDAASWKTDARQLPGSDVDPKVIAWDAIAKELIVGIARLEGERGASKMGLEVKFTWKKQVWTWTGLEAPFAEAVRPADAK